MTYAFWSFHASRKNHSRGISKSWNMKYRHGERLDNGEKIKAVDESLD